MDEKNDCITFGLQVVMKVTRQDEFYEKNKYFIYKDVAVSKLIKDGINIHNLDKNSIHTVDAKNYNFCNYKIVL